MIGMMKDLSVDHQSLEESVVDLSLSAILSYCECLESRINFVTLLRIFLNDFQCDSKFVTFALL